MFGEKKKNRSWLSFIGGAVCGYDIGIINYRAAFLIASIVFFVNKL